MFDYIYCIGSVIIHCQSHDLVLFEYSLPHLDILHHFIMYFLDRKAKIVMIQSCTHSCAISVLVEPC